MNEKLTDFELSGTADGPGDSGPRAGRPRWPYLIGAVAVLLALAAFLWFRRGPSEVAEEPVAAPPAAAPSPTVPEAPAARLEIGEIPTLASSDPWLRALAGQISQHPKVAEWLMTDELIRRFVVAVDNLAEGANPRTHLKVMRPDSEFTVTERDGRTFIDPASYRRYDAIVAVVESVDAAGAAELYRAIRPLCQQAYAALGYPGPQFDDTLRRAIRRVLATPVVEGPVEVERKVAAYRFKDPALERLSPAAKQLLRLGPDNLQRLQTKVRELARAAQIEPQG